MEITLIGLGYVGLPVACSFAKNGATVYGIEKNPMILNNLKKRKFDYTEPGLNEILNKVLDDKLIVSSDIIPSSVYIITVQTPVDNKHNADNSYVFSAVAEIAPFLKDDDLVILESTVPIGTNDEVINLLKQKTNVKFNYCYCPESILPGNIFYEIENNNRTIGGKDEKSRKKAKEIYDIINVKEKSLTGIKEAEFVKLVQNAHRDVEIAFANELSIMCDQEGVNPFDVLEIANKHPRCSLLSPGSGVGGHCLAVDPYFLIERYGVNASLIDAARKVNNRKPIYIAEKAMEKVQYNKTKIIGVLGLSYKPNCEDCRESSGITIVKYLQNKGYKVLANEINCMQEQIYNVLNCDLNEVIEKSDCIIIAQKHKQYFDVDLSKKIVVDSVNLLNKKM